MFDELKEFIIGYVVAENLEGKDLSIYEDSYSIRVSYCTRFIHYGENMASEHQIFALKNYDDRIVFNIFTSEFGNDHNDLRRKIVKLKNKVSIIELVEAIIDHGGGYWECCWKCENFKNVESFIELFKICFIDEGN